MNQKLFLVLVISGSAVAACDRANPESSTPENAGDAGGMLGGDASDEASGKSVPQVGPGAYHGGYFLPRSTPSDAGACVTIDPSVYDTSCSSDADCMSISSGMVCSSGCEGACPNTAINVTGKAHYQAEVKPLSTVTAKACDCAQDSAVACIAGVCTYCPHGCGHETRWQTF